MSVFAASLDNAAPARSPRFTWGRLLLLAALLLGGCAREGAGDSGAVLRVSQRNEPGDLDPATANLPDEFFIIRALSEGLLTPAPDGGAPRPAAAQSWDVSPDGLTYTFHLRPNLSWSNYEPLTAADFVASYQRVLDPATAAPKAALFYLVRSAEDFNRGRLTDFSRVGFAAPDPLTLRITLAHPAPQFPAYVATGPWIPVNPRVVARHGRDWTQPENFVGNGPFTLREWSPNQRITVRRRPAYWDAAHILLDEIQFVAFDNGDAEERAFRAGQIDLTMAVPFTKIAVYTAMRPSPLRQIPLHETRFLAFNTQRPPLNDPRVRQALSAALDRESIVARVLGGGQIAARHFVPDGLGGFHSLRSLPEDVAAARALLAAAGYPGGVGFPILDLTGWTQTPVLEAVQAMWKERLGIIVRIRTRDAKVHVQTLESGRFDIGFITAIPDVADPANLLQDLRSGAANNYSHWHNAVYDRLLDDADHTADAATRLKLLAQAEALVTDEVPVAPLYFNTMNFLQRANVHSWQADPLWTRFYAGVSVSPP